MQLHIIFHFFPRTMSGVQGIKSQRRGREGEADEIRANVEISPCCQISKFVSWDVRKNPFGSGRNQPRNEAFQSNFLAVPSRKIALQSSNDKRTFASFSFQLVSGWMSFLPRGIGREKFLSNVTLNSKALITTTEKSFRKFFVPSTSMNLNVWIRHRINFFSLLDISFFYLVQWFSTFIRLLWKLYNKFRKPFVSRHICWESLTWRMLTHASSLYNIAKFYRFQILIFVFAARNVSSYNKFN